MTLHIDPEGVYYVGLSLGEHEAELAHLAESVLESAHRAVLASGVPSGLPFSGCYTAVVGADHLRTDRRH